VRIHAIFGGIGAFAVKFRWVVIAAWVIAVIAVPRFLPSLNSVTQGNNSAFLPASAPSEQAAQLAAPFGATNPVPVQVIAAETDAAARRLFTTAQQRFLRLIRNQPVELLPPVDSMEPLWQEWERVTVMNKLRAAIVGSDATVKRGLEKLVGDTGANEVIVVTDTYEHADRIESYRRVADVARMIRVRPTVVVEA